jgi:hypothetical protein
LIEEIIDPKFTEETKIVLEGEDYEYIARYGLEVLVVFEDGEHSIDFYGAITNSDYDFIAYGLQEEYNYYTKNSFDTGKTKTITYCDYQEYTEEGEEMAFETFNIMETSIDFSGKDKAFWWLNREDKIELIKGYIEQRKIEELKKGGENHFNEFKPSLLYNFKTKKPSLTVKYINAKAICSFLNSSGGKLYIGINDNGLAQGLEDSDFKIADFNQKDPKDFVRLEFDKLMSHFFSQDIHEFVKADFEQIDDKLIFSIMIKPSIKPVFLKNKKDDNVIKEFYIRTSASSIRIYDPEDIVNYCMSHWISEGSN